MTADLHSVSLCQRAGPVFLDTIEPLPLLDPTAAAELLGVKRHTLACYRNLGDGPAYFKFGRWIRYAPEDLRTWAPRPDDIPLPDNSPTFDARAPAHATYLVDTATAARFLTVTRFCLCNYRVEGSGPPFLRFGRRVHYSTGALWHWAQRQRHRGRPCAQSTVLTGGSIR